MNFAVSAQFMKCNPPPPPTLDAWGKGANQSFCVFLVNEKRLMCVNAKNGRLTGTILMFQVWFDLIKNSMCLIKITLKQQKKIVRRRSSGAPSISFRSMKAKPL